LSNFTKNTLGIAIYKKMVFPFYLVFFGDNEVFNEVFDLLEIAMSLKFTRNISRCSPHGVK